MLTMLTVLTQTLLFVWSSREATKAEVLSVSPNTISMFSNGAAANIGLLINPTSPLAEPVARELQAAAATLRLKFHVLNTSSEQDFATVFATLPQLQAEALL